MKLLMTATNRPEAPKGLRQYGKTVKYDQEAKKWVSTPWGTRPTVTTHPVDIHQGVC